MSIVITDHIDISPDTKKRLTELGATIYEDTPTDEAEIIHRIKGAEIITANYIDITQAMIDAAPKLKFIIAPAVGYEWIDHEYATAKGIKVVNCPTHNSNAVAEHAIALLFAAKRKLVEATASLRAGGWEPTTLTGTELYGKKLGLIGYGRIGKRIATMAAGLGMSTAFANTKSSEDEIDSTIKTSDVVCLCLPLNENTRGMLDERRLRLLQPHSVLINVGRGATIDQEALMKALKEKRIAAAGLDVFENEPLRGAPTEEIVALAKLPNVTATPHIVYNTKETSERLGGELLSNLKACLAEKPINVVN